jgi:hypothetical protein
MQPPTWLIPANTPSHERHGSAHPFGTHDAVERRRRADVAGCMRDFGLLEEPRS